MAVPGSQAAAVRIYRYPAARSASLRSAAALRSTDSEGLETCHPPESIFFFCQSISPLLFSGGLSEPAMSIAAGLDDLLPAPSCLALQIICPAEL